MSILTVIEKDHKAVKRIFRELEKNAESPSARVTELVQSLVLEIKLHAKAEERTLYKACLHKNEKLHAFSMEGFIEHRLLDVVLKKLTKVRPGKDGEFQALLTVAKDVFEHHAIEEEEEEIFPKLKRAFTADELEALGESMIAFKEKLRSRLEMQTSQRTRIAKTSRARYQARLQ
jgi:hemerythrin superfamily protein